SVNYYRNRKTGGEKQLVFLHLFYFRDLLDSPIPKRGRIKLLILFMRGFGDTCGEKPSRLGEIGK
ncbi:hypothetical protein, partial [Peribacillus sp. NPDC097077]|uniref:hypothetical protein n=1 Tax=Peribacillus sp. NPDC097077 TaxID=3390613 RepID=UPI003D01B07A